MGADVQPPAQNRER